VTENTSLRDHDDGAPPSRYFDPWPWDEWTPEQWASWSDDKRTAVRLISGEIWFIWSKMDREDYWPRMPELRRGIALYEQALGS
jgi:hypothetical protein